MLNLTFQFPSPSEIIPPPSPYSTTPLPTSRRPVAPTPPPKRPIVPLFPPGEAPHFPPFPSLPTPLSSRQRKSYQRSAIHRAARAAPNPPQHPRAAPNPPQHPQAAPTFPPLQEAVTKPTSPLPPRKRPRSSSLPPSPGSSPVTLSQQLRRDFNIQELESPGSSPRQEILREERPPSSSPSLSLNFSSLDQRDALSSPDWRDALPREEQDELEESDTEERDFFGESVKEDSIKQDQEEEKSSDIKDEVKSKDSVVETWTTWTRKEGGDVGKELDKGCLDYLDLDLGPLGYLDLDLEPKDIEERTSRGEVHKVMVKLEEIAEFLLYFL